MLNIVFALNRTSVKSNFLSVLTRSRLSLSSDRNLPDWATYAV